MSAAVAACLMVIGSHGAASAMTGNEFQRLCGLEEAKLAAPCHIGITSMVRGVTAADLLLRNTYKIPETAGNVGCFAGRMDEVDGQQVVGLVLQRYRDMPETRSHPLEVMVIAALARLFPCETPLPSVLVKLPSSQP